jgi:hypothetical protein
LLRCIGFSGNTVISGDFGGYLHFWEIEIANPATPVPGCVKIKKYHAVPSHKSHIVCIQQNARRIVSGSRDKTVLVQDFWANVSKMRSLWSWWFVMGSSDQTTNIVFTNFIANNCQLKKKETKILLHILVKKIVENMISSLIWWTRFNGFDSCSWDPPTNSETTNPEISRIWPDQKTILHPFPFIDIWTGLAHVHLRHIHRSEKVFNRMLQVKILWIIIINGFWQQQGLSHLLTDLTSNSFMGSEPPKFRGSPNIFFNQIKKFTFSAKSEHKKNWQLIFG